MNNLSVPIQLAPAPYILADPAFLATLETVEQQAAAIKVTDAATAQAAAQLQVRLTNAGRDLERMRTELTAPFLAAQRKIADVARGPAGRIEAAKSTLKAQLTAYDAAERAKAAEAERVRQAELRRLEIIRLNEERAEAARKAETDRLFAEIAAANKPVPDDLDDPVPVVQTETEKAIEAIKYAPVAVAPKPSGITFRVSLAAVVVDVNALPVEFVTREPKLRALQATFCSGWREGQELPVVPGVRFEVKRTAVSTGR